MFQAKISKARGLLDTPCLSLSPNQWRLLSVFSSSQLSIYHWQQLRLKSTMSELEPLPVFEFKLPLRPASFISIENGLYH